MTQLSRLCYVWLVVPLALGAAPSQADVVVLQAPGGAIARSRIACDVLDYTGEHIRVRLASGQEQTYPAERVVEIETERLPDHLAGLQRFEERQYAAAVPLLYAAYREDERRWVRREILNSLVHCYRELGDWRRGGEVFLILWRSDPTTQYFDSIPLPWTSFEPDAELETQSLGWLTQRELPPAVLLGASQLLPTRHRGEAIAALKGLTLGGDPRVVWLATAQLWRTAAATADGAELEAWYRDVERVPHEVRAGPYFVLGQAFLRRQDLQRGALLLLRVPLVYGRPSELAAQALSEAAATLEQLGQGTEAAELYRTLAAEYPDSRAAQALP